ncbi:MAG: hypothetical protein R3B96_07225 [Pirellulaceae bacterium]
MVCSLVALWTLGLAFYVPVTGVVHASAPGILAAWQTVELAAPPRHSEGDERVGPTARVSDNRADEGQADTPRMAVP